MATHSEREAEKNKAFPNRSEETQPRLDSVEVSEGEKSLDSGMFTGGSDADFDHTQNNNKILSEKHPQPHSTRERSRSGKWIRKLSNYFESHKQDLVHMSISQESKQNLSPEMKEATSKPEEQTECPEVSKSSSSSTETPRKELLRKQLKKHTFGRVKNFVINRQNNDQKMTRKAAVIKEMKSFSTPPTPNLYQARSRCSSPLPTPRMAAENHFHPLNTSCPNSPRFRSLIGGRSETPRCHSPEPAPLSLGYLKPNCIDSQAKWRVKVWLRQVEIDLQKLQEAEENDQIIKVGKEENTRESLRLKEKQRRLSQKICTVCGEGFSLLFNRRLECGTCKLGVCRKCASWKPAMESWQCSECRGQKEFREQSCDWFYDHLQKKLHDFGSAKVIKSVGYNNCSNLIDSATASVRDHIEKVAESLVGENLDSVNVIRIATDENYCQLFEKHHQELSDSLALLAHAIKLVIEKQPTGPGDPTPTNAHIRLKNSVENLIEDVIQNPVTKESEMDILPEAMASDNEMYYADTYEDLLATAIINKVVLNRRRQNQATLGHKSLLAEGTNQQQLYSSLAKSDPNSRQSRNSSSYSSLTSSSLSGVNSSHNKSCSTSTNSDEETSMSSTRSRQASSEDSPVDVSMRTEESMQQYLIEEEIHEVTEYQSDDDGEGAIMTMKVTPKVTLSKMPSLSTSVDCILAELNCSSNEERVTFPEFGVELIEPKISCLSDDEDGVEFQDELKSGLSVQILHESWQDNWLFSQKKVSKTKSPLFKSHYGFYLNQDPIAMLVPNPLEESRAKIGAKDIDELSELSERQSVASLEFSSSSEEEEDDSITTSSSSNATRRTMESFASLGSEQQRDLEHTEYAVLPLQKAPPPSVKEQKSGIAFKEVPDDIQIEEGRILVFACVVEGKKSIDVAWFKGEKLLESNERIEISKFRNKHSVKIFGAKKDDTGHYSCAAICSSEETWHNFRISVKESLQKPMLPSIISHPVDAITKVGEKVTFKLIVAGFPEPRLTFHRNNKRLRSNEAINIEHQSDGKWCVTLKRPTPGDAGVYEVVAVNDIGSCAKAWTLGIVCDTESDSEDQPSTSELSIDDQFVENYLRQATEEGESECETSSIEYFKCQNNNISDYRATPITAIMNGNHVNPVSDEEKMKTITTEHQVIEMDRNHIKSEGIELDLDRPTALPGTIADREHRKWTEKAVPLQNNPYSKESIERRLKLGSSTEQLNYNRSSSSFTSSSASTSEVKNSTPSSRINCGLRSINSARYGRDYYVNNSNGNASLEGPDFQGNSNQSCKTEEVQSADKILTAAKEPKCETPVTSISNKVENTNGKTETKSNADFDIKNRKNGGDEVASNPINNNINKKTNNINNNINLAVTLDNRSDQVDSGAGSSSNEKTSIRVSNEILKFQKEIEIRKLEQQRQKEWSEKKSKFRKNSSVDSLLQSADSEVNNNSSNDSESPPPLPRKGERISPSSSQPESISPPPKLAPKKRVSIAENEAEILMSDTNNNNNNCSSLSEEQDEYDSGDSLATLPSVKELASKFVPKETSQPVIKMAANNNNNKIFTYNDDKLNDLDKNLSDLESDSSDSTVDLSPYFSSSEDEVNQDFFLNLVGKTLPLLSNGFPNIHGEVKIDKDADFEPQVMKDNELMSSSITIDDADKPPSSWLSDNESLMFSNDLQSDVDRKKILTRATHVWSDLGIQLGNSYEFWQSQVDSLDRKDGKKDFKYPAPKFASESNINDALVMLEPGLRKIAKDTNYTTEEDCESVSDSFVYCAIDAGDKKTTHDYSKESLEENPESGFFSYQDQDAMDGNKHVTVIPVNQDLPSTGNAESYRICLKVNGNDLQEPDKDRHQTMPNQNHMLMNVMKVPLKDEKKTIHSLTARSVPRHFREGLKKGMPSFPDRNIKIPNPHNNINTTTTTTPSNSHESSESEQSQQIRFDLSRNGTANGGTISLRTKLHIVYDSENKNLLPYPDGDIIRTSSPEHSGIPAKPLRIPSRFKEEEYTSDDSSNLSIDQVNRKLPPHLRRKLKK